MNRNKRTEGTDRGNDLISSTKQGFSSIVSVLSQDGVIDQQIHEDVEGLLRYI